MAYQRIRDLREDSDLSQAEVAKVLNALAQFHGTSVDYLLGLTNVQEPYPRAK